MDTQRAAPRCRVGPCTPLSECRASGRRVNKTNARTITVTIGGPLHKAGASPMCWFLSKFTSRRRRKGEIVPQDRRLDAAHGWRHRKEAFPRAIACQNPDGPVRGFSLCPSSAFPDFGARGRMGAPALCPCRTAEAVPVAERRLPRRRSGVACECSGRLLRSKVPFIAAPFRSALCIPCERCSSS